MTLRERSSPSAEEFLENISTFVSERREQLTQDVLRTLNRKKAPPHAKSWLDKCHSLSTHLHENNLTVEEALQDKEAHKQVDLLTNALGEKGLNQVLEAIKNKDEEVQQAA